MVLTVDNYFCLFCSREKDIFDESSEQPATEDDSSEGTSTSLSTKAGASKAQQLSWHEETEVLKWIEKRSQTTDEEGGFSIGMFVYRPFMTFFVFDVFLYF